MATKILVINCGSSSVKFQVVEPLTKIQRINGIAERLSTPKASIKWKIEGKKETLKIPDFSHKMAFDNIFDIVKDFEISGVGHRVVHGGSYFKNSAVIDKEVKDKIKSLFPLAPLHNPKNLMGIELAEGKYADTKHVAVFDTSFHVLSMPEKAYRYAVPDAWYRNHQVRRYGFHGTSHKYVAKKAAKILSQPNLTVISAHLGHGCSIAAIKNGHSFDTSMGFSPLEGLIMGARSGDIDVNVIPYICQQTNSKAEEVIDALNKQSGFGAVSGVQDSRDLEDLYFAGNVQAQVAIEMFCYKIAKYIASYFVTLDGIPEALVFTAGIGERSPLKRKIITDYLKPFGYQIQEDYNSQNGVQINAKGTPNVLVIPTNEELVIAEETFELIK